MFKYLLLFVFASFVAIKVDSQALNIKLSSDKTIVEEGFPVTIKFEANKGGQLILDLPPTFKKTNSSNGMNRSIDQKNQKVTVRHYNLQSGAFEKEGKYRIKGVYIVDGKRIKTNIIQIKVVRKTPSKATGAGYTSASRADIEFPDTVFENQPFLIKTILEFEGNNPVVMVNPVLKIDSKSVVLKRISHSSSIGSADKKLLLGTYLCIVKKAGDYRLSLNEFTFSDGRSQEAEKIESLRKKLVISEISGSDESRFDCIIGDFDRHVKVQNFDKTENTFELEITYAGRGDFNSIALPVVEGENFELLTDWEISNLFDFSEYGSGGFKTFSAKFKIPEPKSRFMLNVPGMDAYNYYDDNFYLLGEDAEIDRQQLEEVYSSRKAIIASEKNGKKNMLVTLSVVSPLFLLLTLLLFMKKSFQADENKKAIKRMAFDQNLERFLIIADQKSKEGKNKDVIRYVKKSVYELARFLTGYRYEIRTDIKLGLVIKTYSFPKEFSYLFRAMMKSISVAEENSTEDMDALVHQLFELIEKCRERRNIPQH